MSTPIPKLETPRQRSTTDKLESKDRKTGAEGTDATTSKTKVKNRPKKSLPPTPTAPDIALNRKSGAPTPHATAPSLLARPKPKTTLAATKQGQASSQTRARNKQINSLTRACLPTEARSTSARENLAKLRALKNGKVTVQDLQDWKVLQTSDPFDEHGAKAKLISGYAKGMLDCRESMRKNPQGWQSNMLNRLPVEFRTDYAQSGYTSPSLWLKTLIGLRVQYDSSKEQAPAGQPDFDPDSYREEVKGAKLTNWVIEHHSREQLSFAYGHLLAWEAADKAKIAGH